VTSVVCFIPCCSRKVASGKIAEYQNRVLEREKFSYRVRLTESRSRLEELASNEKYDITFHKSPLTSALYLYKGAFYSPLKLIGTRKEIQAGGLRLFVLSAGYGLVDAFEPISEYNGKMQGRIASFWRDNDLAGVISDILLSLQPSHVYGFFAGSEGWAGAGAKYRYFFVEGLKGALAEGLNSDLSGCFYRASGRGATQILGALGRTFEYFMASGFEKSFVYDVERNSRIDGSVAISFRKESS
jgi:hypothetical protein